MLSREAFERKKEREPELIKNYRYFVYLDQI